MKHKEKPATAQGVVAGKSLQPEDGAKIKEISDNTETTGNNAHADRRIPDWGGIEVSRFRGVKGKAEKPVTLKSVASAIEGKSEKVNKAVKDYRGVLHDSGKDMAEALKKALPAITPGKRVPVGMGRAGKGKDFKIVPVCQIDVDKCGKDNILAVIEVLKGCPDVLLLAKSPSENGVKGLLYLGRKATKDDKAYKAIAKEKMEAIEKLLQPLLASIEEAILEKDPEGEVPKVDKSKLNPSDLMFLTVADNNDELYINYNDVMTGEAEDKIENACEATDDAATSAQGDYPHKGNNPTGRGS